MKKGIREKIELVLEFYNPALPLTIYNVLEISFICLTQPIEASY